MIMSDHHNVWQHVTTNGCSFGICWTMFTGRWQLKSREKKKHHNYCSMLILSYSVHYTFIYFCILVNLCQGLMCLGTADMLEGGTGIQLCLRRSVLAVVPGLPLGGAWWDKPTPNSRRIPQGKGLEPRILTNNLWFRLVKCKTCCQVENLTITLVKLCFDDSPKQLFWMPWSTAEIN